MPFHPDVDEGAALLRTPEARTSRAKRIQLERDHLRLQIKSLWHMEQIYELLVRDWLIPTPREQIEAERANVTVSTSNRINMLKSKMDGHFKFLNKVIPDQASYQVDAQVETADKTQVPNIRIVAFRDQSGDTPDDRRTKTEQEENSKAQVSDQATKALPKKIEAMDITTRPHPSGLPLSALEEMPWLR